MRPSSSLPLLLSLGVLVSGCGTDDVANLRHPDGLLSIVDFDREHADGDYFVVESDPESPFGEVTRAQGGLTWLYLARSVRIPKGSWKLDWRIAADVEPGIDALLRVQPEPGCGEEVSMTVRTPGLGENVWMHVPEDGFHFSVPRTCVVKISLLDVDASKAGWGFDWARIVPAD